MNICVSELIGTMFLIMLGNGVVANVCLTNSKGFKSGWIVIAAGWGFAVFLAASLSQFSGAHLNPAVSLTFLLLQKITFLKFILYLIFQFLGAMIGQIIVCLVYYKQYEIESNKKVILATFCTSPAKKSYFWNIISETIATFFLIVVILGLGIKFNGDNLFGSLYPPLVVGLTVFAIGLSLGGATGYAINPARDLGPRIVHWLLNLRKREVTSEWSYSLIPVVAPLLGSCFAVLFFQIFF